MGSLQQICESALPMPFLAAALQEPRWYAIQTRARHEKKVVAQLQSKNVATFLPLLAQRHRWSDRHKVVRLPLFPGYTFVRAVLTAAARLAVLQTPGIVSFVGNKGLGLPIPDKEIEDIQTLLANKVPCAIYPFLRVGQRVRIRGGCLDGVAGILLARNSDLSLVVSVELIQRSLAIRIDGYDVEMV